jgi:Mn-dependent DtxR family transcriptional regulator
VETWKEFDANELTHSAAHHLLAIHEQGAQYNGWARVSDIARQLGITRGSVSIALRSLKTKGLVTADEHRMVKLTDTGLAIVTDLAAKKATVKCFLMEVLGVSAEQAEIDGCKIEHLISHHTHDRLQRLTAILRAPDDTAAAVRAQLRNDNDH